MATRSSWSRSSSDPAAGRLGTPTSARHPPPQAGEIASRRQRSSAGTPTARMARWPGNAGQFSRWGLHTGTAPRSGARGRNANREEARDGWERRPLVGTARHRRAKSRLADRNQAPGRLGTPTSGRHRPPQAGEIASRRPRRSAGTAWNTAARSAPPAAGGRNRVSPTETKRGDGLERRPPIGTARRRRAKSRLADRNEARERLGTPTSGRHRPPQAGEIASRRPRSSAGTAWNADLRSAPRPDRAAKGASSTGC